MSDARPDPTRLGLILAAAVITLTVVLMFVYKRHGQPREPEAWRRAEQQRSAAGPQSQSPP